MAPALPRAYNQLHLPRKYTAGKRRMSIYVTWSYPAEAGRDVTVMDNRFSTMTEVRRVAWPDWEAAPYGDPRQFLQGIAGSLELFFRGWVPFQELIREVTGHPVPIFQRIDQAGYKLPLDERVLGDTDTLLLFGLDHMATEQEPAPEEIEAVKQFLEREGACLIIGPHHDVGATDDLEQRAVEHAHHGDALVPRQQRFASYLRALTRGLGLPVENRYGLRPALVPGSRQIAPLVIDGDLDARGFLNGVTRFNFHMHLPHYAVTGERRDVRVLARQPIDLTRPHPFTAAGNREFNMFLWSPPGGERAGDVLFADSTIFSTIFGVDSSLERFWRNLATAK
jgi:hypothetical protein